MKSDGVDVWQLCWGRCPQVVSMYTSKERCPILVFNKEPLDGDSLEHTMNEAKANERIVGHFTRGMKICFLVDVLSSLYESCQRNLSLIELQLLW